MNASSTPPALLAKHPIEKLELGSQLSPDGKHLLRRGARVLDAVDMTALAEPSYSNGAGSGKA